LTFDRPFVVAKFGLGHFRVLNFDFFSCERFDLAPDAVDGVAMILTILQSRLGIASNNVRRSDSGWGSGRGVGFNSFLSKRSDHGLPKERYCVVEEGESLTSPDRPASILLVPAGAIGAGLIEQPLPDVLPYRLRSIEPKSVCLLNFDDARAALALDPQDMALDVGKPALLDRLRRPRSGTRIGQHGIP
jgi:hypothetical protein